MYRTFFKRFLDLTISLITLFILSPIFLMITIILFITNKGKPFFFQERPGKNEKIFKIIKFKTMNDKKDEVGNLLPDKDRLTKIGKLIRKTSLDEIPQLINVIRGDMSLIGPRPLLPEYLPYYVEKEKLRHVVRPGITGLAQINGRNNLDWEKRLQFDVFYVENCTFIVDLKIIMQTISNVARSKDVVVALDSKKNVPLNIYRENAKFK